MPVNVPQQLSMDARLELLLAKAGTRDRMVIEKHLTACEADSDPGHATLWRRLLVKLGELVPLPIRVVGSHTVQFFVPDGKYRMQVFALDDSGDRSFTLYMPNVLTKALHEKILIKAGDRYALAAAPSQTLLIQQMDVRISMDPPEFMKHMIGWNRKALKLTLRISDVDTPLINATEQLCSLAAKQWVMAAPVAR